VNAIDLSAYTEQQNRTVQRVLDDLDRWDERLAQHYRRQRDHERKSYRALVTVLLPQESATATNQPTTFQAWARNISRGGLSFVHLQRLRQNKILICLNPAHGADNWMNAEIVRARPIQEEFWEYGVRFLGRAIL
jgi:hypothetical protein